MAWLFETSPRAVNKLFARSRQKSPTLPDSDLLKRGGGKIGTGRRLLSSLSRKDNPRGTTIMSAIGEIQPAEIQPSAADDRSGQFSLLAPAALTIGGTLSLAWACTLGLYAYDLVCWLFA